MLVIDDSTATDGASTTLEVKTTTRSVHLSQLVATSVISLIC